MSSTQHQLIEQCATRLRGIVEALDNIHDSTPHRWSTDLDEVHSSAESLLAMIKDQAPARSEASFEEWLANELEGEDGQPVPAAVCDIALARRAFNHWPKLEQPAKVGGVRFSAGVSSRLVVEAAQRLYEFESTPEKEAERIERLQAFREQLDPLNLAPHAEAFNEAPDEALRPEQAEAERPTYECPMGVGGGDGNLFVHGDRASIKAAQHIVLERDAALARVAELTATRNRYGLDAHYFNKNLQRILRDFGSFTPDELARSLIILAKVADEKVVAQAQHSAGYAEARQCVNCRHIGINDAADYPACHYCRWTGPEPDEDKCPGCGSENCMAAACPECGGRYDLVAEANITAQAGQVPQAWLDVQAERKRQVEVEGWTPEHDDAHSPGEMARAAACYALAGSSAPNDGIAALLVSLAWPWDEQWWKPSTTRRDLVKACALGLAEIERLDRAAASQGGPSDA
ncbi:hypothetical protein ACEPW0_03350 [Pseudomonas aeruginosa]